MLSLSNNDGGIYRADILESDFDKTSTTGRRESLPVRTIF